MQKQQESYMINSGLSGSFTWTNTRFHTELSFAISACQCNAGKSLVSNFTYQIIIIIKNKWHFLRS